MESETQNSGQEGQEQDSSKQKNKPAKKKHSNSYVDLDAEQMLSKIDEMKQSLDKQLGDLYEEGKKHHIDLDRFFGDIKQLSPQNIEKLKDLQKSLLEKLNNTIVPDSCIGAPKKTLVKMSKERKAKTLGARKKWIPM